MDEGKGTYYVDLASGEITSNKSASVWDYQIEASDDEIIRLREYFDQMHSTNVQNFYRAHVPYIQYHYDRENDAYDRTLKDVYKMLHDLGDADCKQHIETIGILGDEWKSE